MFALFVVTCCVKWILPSFFYHPVGKEVPSFSAFLWLVACVLCYGLFVLALGVIGTLPSVIVAIPGHTQCNNGGRRLLSVS